MPTFRIDLEYDGADFSGWAIQPGRRTVEGEMRSALTSVLRAPYELAVAGRTDSGVHATGQVLSVSCGAPVDAYRLLGALRGLLPRDIVAREVQVVPEGFHARYDALTRRYEYRVLPGGGTALRRGRVLDYYRPLDLGTLDACAAALVGQHDFRAFTPTKTWHDGFTRTIEHAAWEKRADELVFVIEANSFLHHMVRVLVGTMLHTARGEQTYEHFAGLVEGQPREEAGPTAPAHALTLVQVTFPAPRA